MKMYIFFLLVFHSYNHRRDCFPGVCLVCPVHQARSWIIIGGKTFRFSVYIDTCKFCLGWRRERSFFTPCVQQEVWHMTTESYSPVLVYWLATRCNSVSILSLELNHISNSVKIQPWTRGSHWVTELEEEAMTVTGFYPPIRRSEAGWHAVLPPSQSVGVTPTTFLKMLNGRGFFFYLTWAELLLPLSFHRRRLVSPFDLSHTVKWA